MPDTQQVSVNGWYDTDLLLAASWAWAAHLPSLSLFPHLSHGANITYFTGEFWRLVACQHLVFRRCQMNVNPPFPTSSLTSSGPFSAETERGGSLCPPWSHNSGSVLLQTLFFPEAQSLMCFPSSCRNGETDSRAVLSALDDSKTSSLWEQSSPLLLFLT